MKEKYNKKEIDTIYYSKDYYQINNEFIDKILTYKTLPKKCFRCSQNKTCIYINDFYSICSNCFFIIK